MVLDDASPQAGSFSSESPPPSAPNKQTPSQMHPQSLMAGLRIKPELIEHPDPLTLYFGFLGNGSWQSSVARSTFDRLQGTWVLTGRQATQEELDAFLVNSTHALYTGRIGLPISLVAGGAWEYRKAARNTPELTHSQRLTTMLQIAKGDPAGFGRQAARTGFRVFWYASLGWMITTIGSTWTGMSSLLTEPKLAQWRQDTKNQKEEDIRKRKVEASRSAYSFSSRREVMERFRRDLSGEGGFDESPTPEPEQYIYDAPAENQSTYDSPASGYQAPSSRYGSAPAPRSSSQGESSSDFFLGGSQDDDASPTAAEYRNTNPDGSPMSSWDRVRAHNAPPRSQPPARQSPTAGWGQAQAQSPPMDPVPGSAQDRYDVDRRREKDQAQADFDKLMENERNASSEPTRRGWGS